MFRISTFEWEVWEGASLRPPPRASSLMAIARSGEGWKQTSQFPDKCGCFGFPPQKKETTSSFYFLTRQLPASICRWGQQLPRFATRTLACFTPSDIPWVQQRVASLSKLFVWQNALNVECIPPVGDVLKMHEKQKTQKIMIFYVFRVVFGISIQVRDVGRGLEMILSFMASS